MFPIATCRAARQRRPRMYNDLNMTIKAKILVIFWLFFIGLTLLPPYSFAQANSQPPIAKEETLEGTVIKIVEEKKIKPEFSEKKQLYQKLKILITKGSLKGKKIVVENGNIPMTNLQKYQIGNRLLLSYSKGPDNNDFFYITDYIRQDALFSLFAIFVVLTIIIGKWRGASSLLGMAISFFIILTFILPKILAGHDPLQTAIIGSLFIIPITFYLSHGFNKKTTVAIVGTTITLIIIGLMTKYFVEITKLTGFASEEASFLQTINNGTINIKGLLLASIIICALGILDDITISQAAIVYQLKKTDPRLKPANLYKKAMDVGQDHISSMVNTLVLAYTGAALPLLLLFVNNPHPFLEVINYEVVADEIVRTIIGSIGLVLAVPITTLIASLNAE